MTDFPMIATASVTRAILDGRQTQDRRPAWKTPVSLQSDFGDDVEFDLLHMKGWKLSAPDDTGMVLGWAPTIWQKVKVGDRLWVRETWGHDAPSLDECRRGIESDGIHYGPYYMADANWFDNHTVKRMAAICMPRWASRITLVVTDARRQRVQDINEEDAKAEGFKEKWTCLNPSIGSFAIEEIARDAFSTFWDSLYGPGSWADNPEICAFTFEAHHCNIDRMTDEVTA